VRHIIRLPRDDMHRQVVCPSITLRYRGHMGWNSSKIISQLISLQTPASRIYSKEIIKKFQLE